MCQFVKKALLLLACLMGNAVVNFNLALVYSPFFLLFVPKFDFLPSF